MMKTYQIQTGQTDWRPRELPQIFTDFRELTWQVIPSESMKFDYAYKDGVDQDWRDWKKIGGISLADPCRSVLNLIRKDRDSIQLGWRWNVNLQVFEFAVYVNEKGKHYAFERADQVLRCSEDTAVAFRIRKDNRRRYRAALYLLDEGPDSVNEFVIETRKRFTLYSRIGLWYGGRNNAAGPYGGKAPKPMALELKFTRT